MQFLLAAFDSRWEPIVWFTLGVLGAVGVLAVLNPRRIAALAMRGESLAETARANSGASQPADGGFYTLALCRAFGVALLAGVVAIAWFVAQR
jgi:hypothetical protein